MSRKLHRGALRTALEYVLIVMGGTALVVTFRIATGGNWYFEQRGYIHPGVRDTIVSGAYTFLMILASPMVLTWLFVGALLYVIALALTGSMKNNVIPCVLTGAVAMIASGGVVILLPPASRPSLPALYFMMLIAGVLGGFFGCVLALRARGEAYQTDPLGWGYRTFGGVWVVGLVSLYGFASLAALRVGVLGDPTLELVFVKWSPAEGEIQEVPIGKYDSGFPHLTESEVTELRAAGFTGALTFNGNNTLYGSGGSSRVVIVMSRGVHETIELPKPKEGDILYIQTAEGWKAFPTSTPTVKRMMRLTYTEANVHQTYPSSNIDADMGLGYRHAGHGIGAFSWTPEEFQAPLPSLAAAKPVAQ